ncbi:MAG: GIY-YIG nuclease family protein [Dehalococcoidia bacterium]
MTFAVYMLLCADGSFYIGHTDNLEKRVAEHEAGLGGGYTHTRLPVALAWHSEFSTRAEALACEHQLKGWSRAKKLALIAGDWSSISLLARSRASTSSARTDEGDGATNHLP